MSPEEIRLALADGTRTLCVKNIWFFTGRGMSCINDSDFNCCNDRYETTDDAYHALMDLADNKPENVEER